VSVVLYHAVEGLKGSSQFENRRTNSQSMINTRGAQTNKWMTQVACSIKCPHHDL